MTKLEERKQKILTWLKDPYNLTLVCILVFSLTIRLYYFFKTYDQGLWWDEGEYLLKANEWAFGTPGTGWFPGRAILLPLISAVIFKVGLGEIGVRLFMVALSLMGTGVVFLLGKELYDKKVGLIAAFFSAIFYLDIFFTNRILVDIPSAAIGLLGVYLFYKGYKEEKTKSIIFGGVLLMLATLMKFPAALFAMAIAVFLIIISKGKALANKKVWYGAIACVLTAVPFVITIFATGRINDIMAAASSAAARPFHEQWDIFLVYVTYLPSYLKIVLFILFIIGLITLINLFLSLDLIIKGESKKEWGNLLSVLMILAMFIYFGFYVNHFEARYLSYAFPFIFFLSSVGLLEIHKRIKKVNTKVAFAVLIIILSVVGFQQLTFADNLTKSKADGFKELRASGLWIKEHTKAGDSIYSSAVPQLTYFTEREVIGMPSEEDFLRDKEKSKYFVLTVYEKSPEWAYAYPEKHQNILKPVQAYTRGDQPTVVIYEILKDANA